MIFCCLMYLSKRNLHRANAQDGGVCANWFGGFKLADRAPVEKQGGRKTIA
jgi:hypothetical protein